MTMQTKVSAVAILALAFALFPAPQARAFSAETNLPWCGDVDGATDCVYATLDECEKWTRPEGHFCTPSSRSYEID